MDRVWVIPEEYHATVGEFYRNQQWRNLVWVYNHYKVGRERMCECSGSFDKMRILFEPFKDIYETGDKPVGEG